MSMRLKAIYLDQDGTALCGGSMFRSTPGGGPSLATSTAIATALRSGVLIVPITGKSRVPARTIAALFGSTDFIFEGGGGLATSNRVELFRGTWSAGRKTVADRIGQSRSARWLLQRFAGRLEAHDPFNEDREVTFLLRGSLTTDEIEEANERLAAASLRLIDNGAEQHAQHVFHLVPAGVSKRAAAEEHRVRSGFAIEETASVGDASADLEVSAAVGVSYIVANAEQEVREAALVSPNVRVTAGAFGEGLLEAVEDLLGH
jgi:hydroxymethylpyrimidine pyrophosphatase-like HAD family hydrolase